MKGELNDICDFAEMSRRFCEFDIFLSELYEIFFQIIYETNV